MCFPGSRARSDRFGFSWLAAIPLRKPRPMTVGFVWISLDSLVRIETYQWVTRDFRWKFFYSRFSPAFIARSRELLILEGEGAGLFIGEVYLDFWFSARYFSEPPLGCPKKGGSLWTFEACLRLRRGRARVEPLGKTLATALSSGELRTPPSHTPRACSPASRIQVRSAKAT